LRRGISRSALDCLSHHLSKSESQNTLPKSTPNDGPSSQEAIQPLLDSTCPSIPQLFSGESQTVAAWPVSQLQISGNLGYNGTDTALQADSSACTTTSNPLGYSVAETVTQSASSVLTSTSHSVSTAAQGMYLPQTHISPRGRVLLSFSTVFLLSNFNARRVFPLISLNHYIYWSPTLRKSSYEIYNLPGRLYVTSLFFFLVRKQNDKPSLIHFQEVPPCSSSQH